MQRHLHAVAGFALLALAAVACSGGSGSSPVPAQHGQGTQPGLTQNATFVVKVPAEKRSQQNAAGSRRSHGTVYVSPRTGSVGIQLATVNGQALLTAPPVTIGNVPLECSGSGSGCIVTIKNVAAAPGQDAFA